MLPHLLLALLTATSVGTAPPPQQQQRQPWLRLLSASLLDMELAAGGTSSFEGGTMLRTEDHAHQLTSGGGALYYSINII